MMCKNMVAIMGLCHNKIWIFQRNFHLKCVIQYFVSINCFIFSSIIAIFTWNETNLVLLHLALAHISQWITKNSEVSHCQGSYDLFKWIYEKVNPTSIDSKWENIPRLDFYTLFTRFQAKYNKLLKCSSRTRACRWHFGTADVPITNEIIAINDIY